MVRRLAFFSVLVLLAAPTSRADDTGGAFNSKELNFEVRLPEDSVDWKVIAIDSGAYPTLRVHYRSVFVDSGAYAEFQVYVQKLGSSMVRKKLERIAASWKGSMEYGLEHPHDRTFKIEKFAGVDAYVVEVKGIKGTDKHRTNWLICKNGEFLYTVLINRSGRDAVADEDVQEEIDSILKSFKFHEIKKVKKGKGAGKGKAPEAPGGANAGKGKQEDMPGIDPEKLKPEKVSSKFWRLTFTKPEGLAPTELTQILKDNQIKWVYRGVRNTIAMGFRVYVWSLKNKKYTLDNLLETRIKNAKKKFGDKFKKPKIDKKFKGVPLAKKAYRLEMVGRSTRTERWIYILAECKNDRQYQLEIYTMGDTGNKEWGKAVEALIKSFQPQKK